MSPSEAVYCIDADDNITFVGADWQRFAQDNDAGHLTAAAVVGTNLFAHIHGAEMVQIYHELFASLRARSSHSEIVIPFRCDSPKLIRHMLLTVGTVRAGGIHFRTSLLNTSTREPQTSLAGSGDDPVPDRPICSVCRSVLLDEGWVEFERAIVRGRMVSRDQPPRLSDGLCPGCAAQVKRGHT